MSENNGTWIKIKTQAEAESRTQNTSDKFTGGFFYGSNRSDDVEGVHLKGQTTQTPSPSAKNTTWKSNPS